MRGVETNEQWRPLSKEASAWRNDDDKMLKDGFQLPSVLAASRVKATDDELNRRRCRDYTLKVCESAGTTKMFKTEFEDNPFGHVCDVGEGLWHLQDLRPEENIQPEQNLPSPSHGTFPSSPRRGHKKPKKGDPHHSPENQRTGKRRQSRGGKTKKRDSGLSPEASVIRARKGSKSHSRRRTDALSQEGGKLAKEMPVEDIADAEAVRQEVSPQLEKSTGHDLGIARPSRRSSSLRPNVSSPGAHEGVLSQASYSHRQSTMPTLDIPQTGAGGHVPGELCGVNVERETKEGQTITMAYQPPQPPVDRWDEEARPPSASQSSPLQAPEQQKSGRMPAIQSRTASRHSIASEGFEHDRSAVAKYSVAPTPERMERLPRSEFSPKICGSAKDSLFIPTSFQEEKTEVRQTDSPNHMTDVFKSHNPKQRLQGVQVRRSVTALNEELTSAIRARSPGERERLPEEAAPEVDQIPDKVEVDLSVNGKQISLSEGLDHCSRLERDKRTTPTLPRYPLEGPARGADTSDHHADQARAQSDRDHHIRAGYGSAGKAGRSSQQPSPKQHRSRKQSRAVVIGPGASTERSALHGREGRTSGNVDEFVERMSVKPMFQDGRRKASYVITADMEQFIPKHVIASAAVTDVPAQKLTPHKLCLLLLLVTLAVFLLIFYSLPDNDDELVSVNTTSGFVEGSRIPFEKSTVYAFLGIPFASSPTGTARFLRPQPVTPRQEPIDGKKMPKLCLQPRPLATNPGDRSRNDTTEDCLSLNVWTPLQPARPVGEPRTVLFVLHGRDFKWSREYNAAALCALGDMVVVVPNYRLHLLGFLGNGTDRAPGNLALFDQIQALRWTVDNAEQFGGNRSSIVILGHGAGALSLGLHLISPVGDQDLWPISRLAFMSGSPLQPLVTNSEVFAVAASLGCNESRLDDGGELQWACLLKQPASEFVTARAYGNLAAGPSFDSDYLPQRWPLRSERLIRKQVLIGNTVSEGLVEIALKMQLMRQDERNVVAFIKDEMDSIGLLVSNGPGNMSANASSCSDPKCLEDVKELYGYVTIKCPVLYFSEYLSSLGHTVYPYMLDYKSSLIHAEEAGHGAMFKDDLALLFGEPLVNTSSSFFYEQDLSRKLIDIFSGFAKTGRLPHASNAEWPRHSRNQRYYVRIDHKGTELISDTRTDSCDRLRAFILPAGFPHLLDPLQLSSGDRYL